ncbi:MAG: glycosyltransferase family 2 protein [Candidatus Sumerlaeia bacterium]
MTADCPKPVLSIIIPVYREAAALLHNFLEIEKHAAATGLSHEYILVDDGSPDGTWEVVKSLRDGSRRLEGIRFSRNFGKEAAISAGLARARGAAAIVMDADLQHPPELIPEMVRLWRDERYDVVEAVKVDRGRESLPYKMSAHLFNWLMCRLTGYQFAGASDFKLLDRRVVDAWLTLGETNTFYRGLVSWMGFRHAQVPMRVAERIGGGTAWSTLRLAKMAVLALTSFSSMPLHIISLLGGILIALGSVMAAWTIVRWVMGWAVAGFTTVILLQVMIGGILATSLGIIGVYLSQIYAEIKRRPRYLVVEAIAETAPPVHQPDEHRSGQQDV